MTSPTPLRSPRSDRVKDVRALGRRAVRDRRGEFLVEGPQAVRELLRHAPQAVRALYVDEEHLAAERHEEVLALAEDHGIRPVPCSPAVLAAMADTPHPQGVLAVARRVDVPLAPVLDALGRGFLVVLSQVRDPGNAGTVLRAADAFGAAAVVVSDASVDVHSPKVVRSSVGSLFHLPVVVGLPLAQIADACRSRGIRLLAADASGPRALPEVTDTLTEAHAWVLGNEAHGLDETARAACDEVVSIPIVRAESLNLAMAATVCLHTSATQQGRSLDSGGCPDPAPSTTPPG